MLGEQTHLKINKLVLQKTGTYNPQYIRPYETHITPDVENMVVDRAMQSSEVNSSTFSGLATQMMTPSATPIAEIPVPNGWNNERLRFIMMAEEGEGTFMHKLYFVQGYTDHPGITESGSVDPKMTFFINSMLTISRSVGMNNRYIDRVIESIQVVNGLIYTNDTMNTNLYTLRPADVFRTIESNNLNMDIANNYNVSDTRTMVNNRVSTQSARKNNNPSSYLSNLIQNYKQSNSLMEMDGGYNEAVYGRAADLALGLDGSVTQNGFFRAIEAITGSTNPCTFLGRNLQEIDPNIGFVTDYVSLGQTGKQTLHHAGDTSEWHGVDRATQIATLLSNAIPGLMMDNFIQYLHLATTNEDSSGRFNTVIYNFNSVTGIDMSSRLDALKTRIEQELLMDLTFNSAIPINLEIIVDVFGDTVVNLGLDGSAIIPYVTPSFSDSLTSPIYVPNRDYQSAFSEDFSEMFSHISRNSENFIY